MLHCDGTLRRSLVREPHDDIRAVAPCDPHRLVRCRPPDCHLGIEPFAPAFIIRERVEQLCDWNVVCAALVRLVRTAAALTDVAQTADPLVPDSDRLRPPVQS